MDGKKTTFPGVIPNLLQRHLETDSEYVRKEIEQYMRETVCSVCNGKRLHRNSLAVKIGQYSIADLSGLSIEDNVVFLKSISAKTPVSAGSAGLSPAQREAIAKPILKEIIKRLESLEKVGLSYLALDRSMNTLSGGEVTRTRLATQLSTGLIGVIYILDEPSIGLHPKDNKMLIATLRSLRDMGNSVIVVEHDSAMMEAADYIIDVGPGAGVGGGEIMAQGTVAQIKKTKNFQMKDVFKEFKPSSWAINNRTAVYIITVIITLAGLMTYNSLPKENFPEVIIPKIFVQTVYPGTSPANMENLITKQLEKEIRGTLGLKKITLPSMSEPMNPPERLLMVLSPLRLSCFMVAS